jgi:chitinase
MANATPNKHCYITSCDGKCDTGDIKITDQPCGDDDKRSKLCCPLSGAPNPKECAWRGNPPLCNGHYHDDEVMMEMNKWGDGGGCNDGNKAYCCKSPLAEENSCYWSGVGGSCKGDDLPLTFSGTVLTILEDVAKVILRVVGRAYPLTALAGEALLLVLDELDLDTDKYYCCPKEDIPKWKNCEWFGKPGSCFDGHCLPRHDICPADRQLLRRWRDLRLASFSSTHLLLRAVRGPLVSARTPGESFSEPAR